MTKMNLSVIIPTYKNKNIFLKNLKNNLIFLKNCEIIIVNDNPKESLKKDLQLFNDLINFNTKIILIENKKNLGFGESVNQGVIKASKKFLMLLNDDVLLVNNNYNLAFKYFEENKNLFAVSFAQEEKNGLIVGKNKIFWKRGMIFHKKVNDLSFGKNAWAEGGASIFEKKKFLELSGFDSLYSPFYWEDIDLSYRAYKKGWQIIFDPKIIVIHHHQSTIGRYFNQSFTEKTSFRNQFIFIWKNITDKKLFLSHLFFLPYYFLYFMLKRKKEFFLGLLLALGKINEIFKKRQQGKNKAELKDKEVFKLFED